MKGEMMAYTVDEAETVVLYKLVQKTIREQKIERGDSGPVDFDDIRSFLRQFGAELNIPHKMTYEIAQKLIDFVMEGPAQDAEDLFPIYR